MRGRKPPPTPHPPPGAMLAPHMNACRVLRVLAEDFSLCTCSEYVDGDPPLSEEVTASTSLTHAASSTHERLP